MSRLRRPPPVYSPLSLGGLAAGWAAAIGLGRRDALERVAGTLRSTFSADTALLTDSGTTGLALAMTAARLRRPGAPVALPAYTCYDVATAAAAADVPVLLYDVDPITLGPDWASLERVLAAGAGAVIVAHLFGFAVDMPRAAALCDAAGAVLIEDAAQAAGGRLRGVRLGAHAGLSVLSFGRGKGITGGGGGALLGRGGDGDLLGGVAGSLLDGTGALRSLVGVSAQWVLGRPTLYALPAAVPGLRLGETIYRAPHPPRRLTAAAATVLLDSLALSEAETELRRARGQRLHAAAHAVDIHCPVPIAGCQPGYLRLPVLVQAGRLAKTAAAIGVARAYPRSLADLTELAPRCRNRGEPVPGAHRLAATLHSVPTHSKLSDADLQRLQDWLGGVSADGRVA